MEGYPAAQGVEGCATCDEEGGDEVGLRGGQVLGYETACRNADDVGAGRVCMGFDEGGDEGGLSGDGAGWDVGGTGVAG